MSAEHPVIQTVRAEDVRPLRATILRPEQPLEASIYPDDEDESTVHVAAFIEGCIMGIASIYNEPPPKNVNGEIPAEAYEPSASYRLRGMATAPEARGRGVGRAVIEECFKRTETQGADFLWCNARLSATGFYDRFGMRRTGKEFHIEGIGPHFVMWRRI